MVFTSFIRLGNSNAHKKKMRDNLNYLLNRKRKTYSLVLRLHEDSFIDEGDTTFDSSDNRTHDF
jgi:hypothetical protein